MTSSLPPCRTSDAIRWHSCCLRNTSIYYGGENFQAPSLLTPSIVDLSPRLSPVGRHILSIRVLIFSANTLWRQLMMMPLLCVTSWLGDIVAAIGRAVSSMPKDAPPRRDRRIDHRHAAHHRTLAMAASANVTGASASAVKPDVFIGARCYRCYMAPISYCKLYRAAARATAELF